MSLEKVISNLVIGVERPHPFRPRVERVTSNLVLGVERTAPGDGREEARKFIALLDKFEDLLARRGDEAERRDIERLIRRFNEEFERLGVGR